MGGGLSLGDMKQADLPRSGAVTSILELGPGANLPPRARGPMERWMPGTVANSSHPSMAAHSAKPAFLEGPRPHPGSIEDGL